VPNTPDETEAAGGTAGLTGAKWSGIWEMVRPKVKFQVVLEALTEDNTLGQIAKVPASTHLRRRRRGSLPIREYSEPKDFRTKIQNASYSRPLRGRVSPAGRLREDRRTTMKRSAALLLVCGASCSRADVP